MRQPYDDLFQSQLGVCKKIYQRKQFILLLIMRLCSYYETNTFLYSLVYSQIIIFFLMFSPISFFTNNLLIVLPLERKVIFMLGHACHRQTNYCTLTHHFFLNNNIIILNIFYGFKLNYNKIVKKHINYPSSFLLSISYF